MPIVHAHMPLARLREHAPLLRERGMPLELFLTGADLDSLGPGWASEVLETLDYGPPLTVHGPFMDLSPGAVDSKVRAVTVERFHSTLEAAKTLGARAVVFHSGYEKWKYAHRVDIWLENSLRTWRPLAERAAEYGVRIAVENIFEDSPEPLAALMGALGSPHFGVCFDAGHFNLFSREKTLKDWLAALAEYIIELHLHDNDGSMDSHWPVGSGTFPFKVLFEELKGRELIYTVEAHRREDLFLSLERLREFLPGF